MRTEGRFLWKARLLLIGTEQRLQFRLKRGVAAARLPREHNALAGFALESGYKDLLELFPAV
jgi:hypothetical protein